MTKLATASAVAVLTAALFAPAVGFDYVNLDDPGNFVANDRWRGFSGENLRWMATAFHEGHYQPLSWLTLAADHGRAAWLSSWLGDGFTAVGEIHRTNVVLHAWNAACVCWLGVTLLRLRRDDERAIGPAGLFGAAVAALLWSLHPLRVESVAWATERRDVLSVALLLPAVLAYLRYGRDPASGRAGYWLAWALLTLSLAAKAWAIVLPAVLLALDAWPLRRFGTGDLAGGRPAAGPPRPARVDGEHPRLAPRASSLPVVRVLAEKIPFVAVAGVFALLASSAQRASEAWHPLALYPLPARLANAALAAWWYVGKTLWPAGLHPYVMFDFDASPWRWPWVAAWVGLFAAGGSIVFVARKRPAVAVAAVSAAAFLSPVIGLSQSGYQLAADRYAYVAAVPLSLLIAGGLAGKPTSSLILAARGLAAVAIVALAVTTRAQLPHWADGPTLVRHAVAVDPDNPLARKDLGVVLARENEFAAATAAFSTAYAATADDPARAAIARDAYLGLDLTDRRATAVRGEEAATRLRAVLDRSETPPPDDLASLADALIAAGGTGLDLATRAAETFPEEPRLVALRGFARVEAGETDAGLADLAVATPEIAGPTVGFRLGEALVRAERYDEAAAVFARTLPRCTDPRLRRRVGLNLGTLHYALRRSREAVATLAPLARAFPFDDEVWFQLGLAHEDLGRPRDAHAAYVRAGEVTNKPERKRRALEKIARLSGR